MRPIPALVTCGVCFVLGVATKAIIAPPVVAPPCVKKTCSQIASCDEAVYLLTQCGFRRLDGDGDGIPCETLCRKTN